MRILSLPENRLGRVLRNKAKTLQDLEKKAKVEITAVKAGGECEALQIEGEPEGEWAAEQSLKAISVGFEPKHAFKLLDEKYFIEIIDLALLLGGKQNAIQRYKARIIGTEGKVKQNIEELSGALVAVGESEVGIIGEYEDLRTAKEAITRLLEGSQHGSVFAWLKQEKRKKEAQAMGLDLKRVKKKSADSNGF